mmetsp:Transcript_30553/g.50761  ORF Transcript_30553/g.50761 Transcript_30553/m.50761 type:complete len:419 (+) Transcript_30553:208-1464(+)
MYTLAQSAAGRRKIAGKYGEEDSDDDHDFLLKRTSASRRKGTTLDFNLGTVERVESPPLRKPLKETTSDEFITPRISNKLITKNITKNNSNEHIMDDQQHHGTSDLFVAPSSKTPPETVVCCLSRCSSASDLSFWEEVAAGAESSASTESQLPHMADNHDWEGIILLASCLENEHKGEQQQQQTEDDDDDKDQSPMMNASDVESDEDDDDDDDAPDWEQIILKASCHQNTSAPLQELTHESFNTEQDEMSKLTFKEDAFSPPPSRPEQDPNPLDSNSQCDLDDFPSSGSIPKAGDRRLSKNTTCTTSTYKCSEYNSSCPQDTNHDSTSRTTGSASSSSHGRRRQQQQQQQQPCQQPISCLTYTTPTGLQLSRSPSGLQVTQLSMVDMDYRNMTPYVQPRNMTPYVQTNQYIPRTDPYV